MNQVAEKISDNDADENDNNDDVAAAVDDDDDDVDGGIDLITPDSPRQEAKKELNSPTTPDEPNSLVASRARPRRMINRKTLPLPTSYQLARIPESQKLDAIHKQRKRFKERSLAAEALALKEKTKLAAKGRLGHLF